MSLFESIEKVKLNNRQALQEVKDELIQPSERKIEGQKKIVSKAEKQITRVKPGERVKQRNIVKKFFSTGDDPKVSGDSSMRDIEGDKQSNKIRQEIERSTGQKTRDFTRPPGTVTPGNERLRKDPLDTSITKPVTKHQKLRAQTTGLQKKYQLKPDSRGMVKPTKAVVLDRLTTNIKKASTPPKPGAKKDAVALQKFNQQIRKSKKYSGNENAKRVEKIVKRIAKNQKIDKTKAGLVQRQKDIAYGKNPYKKVFGSTNLNLQKRYDKAMLDMGGKTARKTLKPYEVQTLKRQIAAKEIKKPTKTMTYLAPAGSGKPVPLKTVQQQQQQQPQQGRSRPNPNVSTETQQERARRLRDRVNKGNRRVYVNPNRTRTLYTPSKDELEKIKSTLTRNTRKSFGDTLTKNQLYVPPTKELEKIKVTQGNKLLNKGFKSGTRGMTKANLFTKLSRRIGTKGKIGLALAGAALAYQALKPKTKTKTKTETPGGGVPIPVNPSNFKMVPASLKFGVKQTKLPSPAINPSTNRQYTDAQGGTSQNKINRFVARSTQAKR